MPRMEGMRAHTQLPDCAAWCAPRTRARVCTHLQQRTAPHRHRLASQMNAHEHTRPSQPVHALKQSHTLLHIQTCTRARTRTHERTQTHTYTHTHTHTHTHTSARARAHTHTPAHALPHTHASRHLDMKLHTRTVRVCAQARARAHTHTQIQAQHAGESARGEIEPFLARTLTHRTQRAHKHISKHTRTRTAGRAGTARHPRHRCVCSHARARGVCACTHSVLDTRTSAPPHMHVRPLTHTRAGRYDARRLRTRPLSAAPRPRKIRTSRSAPT